MTKIDNKNIYPYGIYYNNSEFRFPTEEQNWTGMIVYTASIKNERFTSLSSLEGFFVSDKDLNNPNNNLLCRKDQIKDFEKKHEGKFIPFDE